MKLLLDKNANVESKDNECGGTPLLWAAKLPIYDSEAIMKLLLDKNANVESKDNECGGTPLLWAAKMW